MVNLWLPWFYYSNHVFLVLFVVKPWLIFVRVNIYIKKYFLFILLAYCYCFFVLFFNKLFLGGSCILLFGKKKKKKSWRQSRKLP